ncbi:hypothetical protein VTK73DRAFT_6248 [Phialemonium thermophilum]|uniref:Fork-head domain-containing protein n=1 Tax=Phialemonium thermophilum TaxID=223376 RepID=A0ABR3WKA5_9PEZI
MDPRVSGLQATFHPTFTPHQGIQFSSEAKVYQDSPDLSPTWTVSSSSPVYQQPFDYTDCPSGLPQYHRYSDTPTPDTCPMAACSSNLEGSSYGDDRSFRMEGPHSYPAPDGGGPPDDTPDLVSSEGAHGADRTDRTSVEESGQRKDEAYARLIYRAFMSNPRRAMTLQELYKWFKDNTDKDKSQSKGWQNSIRHNLSMNKAFQRRERRVERLGSDEATESEHSGLHAKSSKKLSEWYLEEWAQHDGVQSTTRYRDTSKRRGITKNRTSASRQKGRKRESDDEPSRSSLHTQRKRGQVLTSSLATARQPPLLQGSGGFAESQWSSVWNAQQHHFYAASAAFQQHQQQHVHLGFPESQERLTGHFQQDEQPVPSTEYAPGYGTFIMLPSVPEAPTVLSDGDTEEVYTPEATGSLQGRTPLVPDLHIPPPIMYENSHGFRTLYGDPDLTSHINMSGCPIPSTPTVYQDDLFRSRGAWDE